MDPQYIQKESIAVCSTRRLRIGISSTPCFSKFIEESIVETLRREATKRFPDVRTLDRSI